MGHNEHFLERVQERLDFHQMDRAMSLYRDPAFVRDLLAILKLSDGVQRVALELEPGDDGPYVVVERDGTLVTCLAKGMAVSALRVVRKAELDGLFARGETMRGRQRALDEVIAKQGGVAGLLLRLQHGAKVSRETIRALQALVPLQSVSWYATTLDMGFDLDLLKNQLLVRHAGKKAGPEVVERFAMGCWAHANLFALSLSMGLPAQFKALPEFEVGATLHNQVLLHMAHLNMLGPYLRGLWALSRVGVEVLPELKEAYRDCIDFHSLVTTSIALFGTGQRSRKVRGEVRKLLEKGPQVGQRPGMQEVVASMKQLTLGLSKVLDVAPEAGAAMAASFGQQIVVAAVKPFPEGHPLRFESAEAVPAEWAAAYLYNLPLQPWRNAEGLNVVVSCAPHYTAAPLEDLFLPEAALPLIPDWHPSFGERLLEEVGRGERGTPLVAAKKVGRNDPCSCGSGEKYKKCCMGKGS